MYFVGVLAKRSQQSKESNETGKGNSKWIQKESGLNREEMLNIFNCGYGMVVISSANLPLKKIGRLYKK